MWLQANEQCGAPEPALDEAPAEELAGFGTEFVQADALHNDGDDIRPLTAYIEDAQAVAQRLAYGHDASVPERNTATVACSIAHTQTATTLPAMSGPTS